MATKTRTPITEKKLKKTSTPIANSGKLKKTSTPITKKKMKTSTPLSPVAKLGAAVGKAAATATAAGTAKTTSSKGSGMKAQITSVNRATGKKTTTTKNLTPITEKEFKGSGMMKRTSTPIKKKTY